MTTGTNAPGEAMSADVAPKGGTMSAKEDSSKQVHGRYLPDTCSTKEDSSLPEHRALRNAHISGGSISPFSVEAIFMMELPKRRATSLYGQPVRTPVPSHP